MTTVFSGIFLSSHLSSFLALSKVRASKLTHIVAITVLMHFNKSFKWLQNFQIPVAHSSCSNLHLHLSLGFEAVLVRP